MLCSYKGLVLLSLSRTGVLLPTKQFSGYTRGNIRLGRIPIGVGNAAPRSVSLPSLAQKRLASLYHFGFKMAYGLIGSHSKKVSLPCLSLLLPRRCPHHGSISCQKDANEQAGISVKVTNALSLVQQQWNLAQS